ncbi:MAG: hypothetical protein KI792_01330 [Alphaproteobacteria bacterium]|nr:hypothetical protein [Alphaproteobacteria bacterium SS10]
MTGLPPGLQGLAGDINAASGGSSDKGAEINAASDLVDVNAWRGVKRLMGSISSALGGDSDPLGPSPMRRR